MNVYFLFQLSMSMISFSKIFMGSLCCNMQIPVALLIAQLQKDENPCLLHFSEMVALFHEFSHVVHFSVFHLSSCAPSFPSLPLMSWDPGM